MYQFRYGNFYFKLNYSFEFNNGEKIKEFIINFMSYLIFWNIIFG